jgi:excisionase family DNA binding protein
MGSVVERPYTPERLAERWECSPSLVRKMLETRALQGFKVGGKLWRIPAGEVDRFECQTTDSEGLRAGSSPSGMTAVKDVDGALLRKHRLKRERHCGSLPVNVTRFYDHKRD